VATASDYRTLLREARKAQLRQTREDLQRLAEVYDRAAKGVVARIEGLPDNLTGIDFAVAQANLLRGIDEELTRLKTEFAGVLDLSMLSSAQQMADRQDQIERLIRAKSVDPTLFPIYSRSVALFDGTTLTASFGTLAQSAVETAATRYFKDGLKLSDRLYNLDVTTRKTIEDTLLQGLADGSSARDIAKQMTTVLTEAGAQTPKYNAMRIARTEVNNVQREASVMSVSDSSGRLKSYVTGVRWNLSASHPSADICDVWAAGGSENLPAGVYLPGDVPIDHPHGLCYVTPELVDFPGIGGPGKEPDIEKVPKSQIAYYAAQGDEQAAALLARAA